MKAITKALIASFAAAAIMTAGQGLSCSGILAAADNTAAGQITDGTKSIDGCSITLSQSLYEYSGEPVVPGEEQLTVTDGETVLVRNVDYTLSLTGNTEPGEAAVTVAGIGRYSGSTQVSFTIAPKPVTMNLINYGNGGIRVEWDASPSAHAYQIIYSQDEDFASYHSTTVKDPATTYVNLTKVPRAGETWYVKVRPFITATGDVSLPRCGTYCSAKRITTHIDANTIRTVTIPYISYTYTGKAVTPEVKVKNAMGVIVPPENYSVVYSSNVNVGKARITVRGKGSFKGSVVKEFYVKPAKEKITSAVPGNSAFRLNWTRATEGAVGYQVLYSRDKAALKAATGEVSSVLSAKYVHSYTSTNLDDLTENFSRVPGKGETWYVKVRAFITKDGTASTTRYGNYSAVTTVQTQLYSKALTAAAYLYKAAAYDTSPVSRVTKGTKAAVLEEKGLWYKVYANGNVGYVYNKAFGVTANTTSRIYDEKTVVTLADDILFDIGTSAEAIWKYVCVNMNYLTRPYIGTRNYRAAVAATYHTGSCYYYSALTDLLFERAGYDHEIIQGKYNGCEHNFVAYKRKDSKSWLYAETVPSAYGRIRSYTLTADYLLTHKYTWDRTKYVSG